MIDSAIPPHRNGSHHGDTRIIRHAYGEGEKYVPLVLRAQALWNALIQQSGEELFQSCGVLNLGAAALRIHSQCSAERAKVSP
ncbi:N-methyl-L-tryptophan oxidase [Serratia marcescens]|uniref:N-methyl-L-tryptophan oxidase n=1 Tax=Serratia marcescens TaxID=615 RepID=A0A380A3D1_SERMA|nr:N-methyl-L-tryptophan oxidase [Serratia marcescens]